MTKKRNETLQIEVLFESLGPEVPKVKEFRYLGSTVQCNGGCDSEVKRGVQAGWNNWRRVSEVICDRRLSACVKGIVYKTVVRPAMLYGLRQCH